MTSAASRPRRALGVAAVAVVLAAANVASARAAELTLLSAGAVEPGLRPAVAAFERATGHTVRVAFAAAPALREALRGPASADVVIAPEAALDEARAALAAPADRVPLGRVGVGVAVREGAEVPDVSSADALRAALERADAIVFNRASTGAHVEKVLPTLPLSAPAMGRVERFPDGASVLQRLVDGKGAREIGFAAITEISLLRGRGIRFVGPLPAPLQNETAYAASAWRPAAPERREAVAALLRHLADDASRAAFRDAGIAPPR